MTKNQLAIFPVTLQGTEIRLEPLSLDHLEGLCAIGLREDLWKWIPTQVRNREDMRRYVEEALDWQAKGVALPFATVIKQSGQPVGSTRFAAIDVQHQRVEIGWTWVGVEWQRTKVNTEAKYLMLKHAFETLHCIRVELKTDALNSRSRNAISRIGAKEEGTLRRHIITDTGRVRDTVYFSILDHEWPAVKLDLEHKLAAGSMLKTS